MWLPDVLEQQLRSAVYQFEEEKNIQYITSFERLAREEGRQEATSNLLVHLLQHRFGEVPEDVQMRLSVLDIKPAAVIVDLALTCRSLADFVAHLPA